MANQAIEKTARENFGLADWAPVYTSCPRELFVHCDEAFSKTLPFV
jgi:hypothetical protein